MGETINAHKNFGKNEKYVRCKPRRNCEDKTKKDFRLKSRKERRWMELAHDRVQWRGHVENSGSDNGPLF